MKQPDVTPKLRHQAATARVRRVAGPPTTRKNNLKQVIKKLG
jgi:hypothetical protein